MSLETHGANPFDHRRQDGQGLIPYALSRGEEYELRLALRLTSSEQLLSQVDNIREIFKQDPLHRWMYIVFALGSRYSNPTHVECELQRFYDMVYNTEDEVTGEVSLSDTHNTTYVTDIMGVIINAFQKLIQLPRNVLGQQMTEMIQRLEDLRSVLLSHRRFLNNGFFFFDQQNLDYVLPQLMVQDGLDPGSNSLMFKHLTTEERDIIFPISAHIFCYIDEGEHIAVKGLLGGLHVFNTHTSSVTEKIVDVHVETCCMAVTKKKRSRILATTAVLGTSNKAIQIWDTSGRELHFTWNPRESAPERHPSRRT